MGQALESVVAGQPPTHPGSHVSEWKVDLIVTDDHPVEWDFERSSSRPDAVASAVHEGLWTEQGDPWTARADRSLGEVTREARLCSGHIPSARQLRDDIEADVVPGPGVLGSGVTETDHQAIDSSSARPRVAASPAEQSQVLAFLVAGAGILGFPASGFLATLASGGFLALRGLALLADELGLFLG